ncbi:Bug family tripartite tricarboxylate transporter substrate binding protein [Paracraurococcus lichenis]|uniref:Tripartite tricarboxylate transporter substrate-binding protein n=1 Tax=Paracraurococcus lichenis TaxID=3064888 RepID=A0ABT9DVU3_9PROT|nr:tripartite tricarboxylate transporter substrate-binding protein [Paracraurococcus sp. LOR1-02]MDO9708022.1 tripartite tricarboxylate transporter substrate-binding protein [Paracraurococcus sp. LOR1-02]
MLSRRTALAAPLLLLGAPARAQDYPERTVRLIVPFTPAGQTDIISRLVAQRLQQDWGKPVVVENRPGANAQLGADAVAKAAPDGHTLLAITLTHAVNTSLFPHASYDFLRDLQTLTLLGSLPLVVVVRAGAPWEDLPALVAAVRGGARLNVGSSGSGSPPHLGLELFRRATGAAERLTHVPYRGGAPSVTDLVAGNLDLLVSNLPECIGQVQAGRLRALAVTADARHPLLPEVPTATEAGLPQLRITSWTAIQAPSGLPEPLAGRIAAAIRQTLTDPGLRGRAAELGFDLVGLDLAASRRFVAAEVTRYAQLVAEAGIRAE